MEAFENIKQNIDHARAIVNTHENAEIMAVVKTRSEERRVGKEC